MIQENGQSPLLYETNEAKCQSVCHSVIIKFKNNCHQKCSTTVRLLDEAGYINNYVMDSAKTYKVKTSLKWTFKSQTLISFLVFYFCVINVIIMCDVSVNNVNNKLPKKLIQERGEKHFKLDHKSAKRQIVESDNTKYSSADLQDLNGKYYHYFKNKEDLMSGNGTDQSPYLIDQNFNVNEEFHKAHTEVTGSYQVKRINTNLRPNSNQFREKIVKLGVLLPADPDQVFSLVRVLPILEMAVAAVTREDGPLPGWQILMDYRDTECSSVDGPLAAFEFYVNGTADAFIGPGCEYVIAPVARYAGHWRIPVLTAGAQAEPFYYKRSYPTLTRMMGSYTQAGVAIRKVLEEFNWRNLGMLYHNNDLPTGKGNSPCFMTLSAVFSVLQKKSPGAGIPNIPFDENVTKKPKLKKLLQKLSLSTRSK